MRDRVLGAVLRTPGAHRLRRVTERADLRALAADEAAVASLEVAVAENAWLAARLEQQVAALEAGLVPVLAARHPELSGPAGPTGGPR